METKQTKPPTQSQNTKQARWLFLEVPYAEDATKMHAVLGFTDPAASSVQCLVKDDLPDIPAAIEALTSVGKTAGIQFDSSLVLVIPLDNRMMLASIVREQADKQGCNFSRHIPAEFYPNPADFPFITATGSAEDTLKPDFVRERLSNLYDEGEGEVERPGGLLDAMGPLRHALRLGVHHFGWNHFGTVYVLRDLAGTYIGTGADENMRECLFLVRILQSHIKPEEWGDDAELFTQLLGQLATGCETMGDAKLAEELRGLK